MKSPFIIVFEDIADNEKMAEFSEIIRSSFISKKSTNNSFIIKSSEVKNSREIFETIQSKLSIESGFFVIEMNNFYGRFSNDALKWMYEQFPEQKWVAKPEILDNDNTKE